MVSSVDRALLEQLYRCSTRPEAQRFFGRLPPLRRRAIALLAEPDRARFLDDRPKDTFFVSLAGRRATTDVQFEETRSALRDFVAAASYRAQKKERLLHIVVGESHICPTSVGLAAQVDEAAMLSDEADLGVEIPLETRAQRRLYEPFVVAKEPGFDETRARLTAVAAGTRWLSECVDEHSTLMPGSVRKNHEFLMLRALHRGRTVFSVNPLANDFTNDHERFLARETDMVEALRARERSSVSLVGNAHLRSDFMSAVSSFPHADALFFDVSHFAPIARGEGHHPGYGDPNSPLYQARVLSRNRRRAMEPASAADPRVVYIDLPGQGFGVPALVRPGDTRMAAVFGGNPRGAHPGDRRRSEAGRRGAFAVM
jgi:hypothetical protein